VLRLESPFRGHYRRVLRDTQLAGTVIGPGDRLFILWGSANREGEIFEDADSVDLDRTNPRQHLAFGNGLHFCIGAPLARLEAEIALATLFRRYPSLQLATDHWEYVDNFNVRQLRALPLRY
jgi:cytochrome P450